MLVVRVERAQTGSPRGVKFAAVYRRTIERLACRNPATMPNDNVHRHPIIDAIARQGAAANAAQVTSNVVTCLASNSPSRSSLGMSS